MIGRPGGLDYSVFLCSLMMITSFKGKFPSLKLSPICSMAYTVQCGPTCNNVMYNGSHALGIFKGRGLIHKKGILKLFKGDIDWNNIF